MPANDLSRAHGEGGALAVTTPVPTPQGWTTVGSLRTGDPLFGPSGELCSVVRVTAVLLGRACRRVHFSDGSNFVTDGTQLWFTQSKTERKHRKTAGRARMTDEIASTLRIGEEFNHQVSLAGPARYPTRPNLPIDPYVLGYWLGDGTSTKAEVTIGMQDEAEVIENIRAAGYAVWHATAPRAFRIGGVSPGRAGRKRDSAGRFTSDQSLSSILRRTGLLGNKHVPTEYLTAGFEQRLSLLQGLMDADGYCDGIGRCEFVSTKATLADAVHELASSLGLRASRRTKRAMLYGVDCGPAYQVKFTPRLPIFRLTRKVKRLKTATRAHLHRSVVAVEGSRSVPMRGVDVSSRSGQFLIGRSYVPTNGLSTVSLGWCG